MSNTTAGGCPHPAHYVEQDNAKSSQESGPIPGKMKGNIFGMVTKIFKRNNIPRGAGRLPPDCLETLWTSHHDTQSISPEHLSPDDVIIAVMGPTGAGKSSFIRAATKTNNGVGDNLESYTTEISAARVTVQAKVPFSVIFIDTPGFDDTSKSDREILEMIAQWLKKSYERNIQLSGILYLHRISDNRIAGTPLKNLRMFNKLCGKNALPQIILVTTMWDDVQGYEGDR